MGHSVVDSPRRLGVKCGPVYPRAPGVVIGEFIGGESGGGIGYLIISSLGTLNSADMMVSLIVLAITGIVMALGIKQVEMRLLRWRPEYQKR